MLKSFFSTAAIALSLSLTPIIALADTAPVVESQTLSAEKIKLITELRTLTRRDENATQTLDLMINQIQEQGKSMGAGLFGEDPDPAITQAFNDTFTRITKRIYELMQDKIDFVAVQQEIDFKLYDEYFTEAELQDLIDFYKTPTGQKTAEVYPQLTQRSMELFGEQLNPAMMEIQQQVLMEEFSSGFDMMSGDESSEEMPLEDLGEDESMEEMPIDDEQEAEEPLPNDGEAADPMEM